MAEIIKATAPAGLFSDSASALRRPIHDRMSQGRGRGDSPKKGVVKRMPYLVKELFYTLQGEGRNTGRPAVFCRFAGCNLWSGHDKDRASAICRFCDTVFVGTDGPGGGRFA